MGVLPLRPGSPAVEIADGQGFAAFGQVVKGMDVVKKIHALPANGQTLQTPIRILNVMR